MFFCVCEKMGDKKIRIERECYEKLEKRAKERGLTVGEYATKLVARLVQTPIQEVLETIKGARHE